MRKLIVFLLVISPLIGYSQTITPPIAWWNFNGNANDKSGNGWNATVYGCTLTAGKSGLPNTAYKFNGNGDHMMVYNQQRMNLHHWTIMALVKPKGFYSGNCESSMILERGLFTTSSSHSLFISDNAYDNSCGTYTPDKMVFGAVAAGTSGISGQNGHFVDTVNTWYCVTATYGNDTMKMYLDGTMIESGYWPDQYGSDINDSLRIGCGTKAGVGYPNWFNGIMDHINIFDYVLTPAQVDSMCSFASTDTGSVYRVPPPAGVGNVIHTQREIAISPNPAKDNIYINVPDLVASAEILVVNSLGQTIRQQKIYRSNANVNVADLPAGIYYIKVVQDDSLLWAKFLKE